MRETRPRDRRSGLAGDLGTVICPLPHHPGLAGHVLGYWLVEDLSGAHAGQPIRTCPFPGAVLTVNLGRPNALVDGPTVPRVSLLGVQERWRAWQSWDNTSFLMACLTPEGLATLFPDTGVSTAGTLTDVGSLIGDRAVDQLARAVAAAPDARTAAGCFDRWLLARMDRNQLRSDLPILSAARRRIAAGASIEGAANAVGTTRRQLARWHVRHFGVAPARLKQLGRLQRSVRAVQDGRDGVNGFADQAHQIRNWKQALGVTPGAYRRRSRSLADLFEQGGSGLSFYL